MRAALGCALVALPFVVVTAGAVKLIGVRATLLVWALTVATVALLGVGVFLAVPSP